MTEPAGIIQKNLDINEYAVLGIKPDELKGKYSWYAKLCQRFKRITVQFLDACAVVVLTDRAGRRTEPAYITYDKVALRAPANDHIRLLAIYHPDVGRIYTAVRPENVAGNFWQIIWTIRCGQGRMQMGFGRRRKLKF